MKDLDLLTIGDANLDLFMSLEGMGVSEEIENGQPQLCFYHGTKIPVKTLRSNVGGNALNVAFGACSLGLKVGIYTELGNDEYGEKIENELKKGNIDTSLVVKNDDAVTGIHPVIMYGGERTIFSHHEERPYKIQNWGKPKWIYYTSLSLGFEKFQKELVEYLKQNPEIGIAFNPGTYQKSTGLEGLRNIIEVTHVLFVNTEEAEVLVGKGTTSELHEKLHALGPKLTVITNGGNGSSGFDGKQLIEIGIHKPEKEIVDKTGAGDSYSAGAISALIYGKPLREALMWGAVNSAGVITEIGATHGLKTKNELEKIIDTER